MLFTRIPRLAMATGVLVGCAAIWPQVEAQRATPGQSQMYRLQLVRLRPGNNPAYVAAMKDVTTQMQKGGVTIRQAYSSGAFGETGSYAYFVPVTSFAEFDGQPPLVKAMGEEPASALMQKVNALVQEQRYLLVRTRPDLSYVPDPRLPAAPLAVVSEVDVASGRRGDFEMLLKKDVLPVMQQAKVRSYSVLEVVLGGNVATYFTSIGYETYEGIGKGHPFEAVLGQDGARKLEGKFGGVVTRLERTVVRYRPDLSFAPPASGTN
jgi:hypothetical protein